MTSQTICKIDGCGKYAKARGWCSAHYDRWRVHRDPNHGGKVTSLGEPLAWLQNVALTHHDYETCLKWPYADNGHGYGVVWIDGNLQLVHRVVCEAISGPPPSLEYEAAHSCGKGKQGCVSPHHLRWATRTENESDKIAHGTAQRGERATNVKLTESDVLEIFRLYAGGMLQREIAEKFGVLQSSISMITSGKRWGWLEVGQNGKTDD